MIEIPESYTLAKQLNETIRGKTVQTVSAGHTSHRFTFFLGNPQDYPGLLEGKTIDQTEAVAGQVELSMGDARLVFNDGTNLRYLEKGEKRPQKHQFLMELEEGSALACTVQMYGGIYGFLEGGNDSPYYLAAKEKPSPLSAAFDPAYFEALWEQAKPTLSVKAFLAAEQRIPGLGNGALQDILFQARINPKTKISEIRLEEKENLYKSVKETLKAMADGGGRDTEKDLFGSPGGYETILSKNTWQRGCPRCGGPIVRTAFLGGNVYYCPVCQPLGLLPGHGNGGDD